MQKIVHKLPLAAVIVSASLLAACGGGGGGGTSGTTSSDSSVPTAAEVVITEANKTQVAAAIVDAATNSGSAVSPIGIEIASTTNVNPTGIDKIVTDLLTMQLSTAQSQSPMGVEISGSGNCMGGDPNAGSRTWIGQVTDQLADPLRYPYDGDYVTIRYNNCIISQSTSSSSSSDGTPYNYSSETRYTGEMTETVISHTNNTRTFTVVFNNLSTTTTQTINGATSTLQSSSIPNMTMTVTVTGGLVNNWFNIAKMDISSTGNFNITSNGVTRTRSLNQLQESFRMNQYALDGTYIQNSNYTREYTINGLMGVDRMGGAANITSITPFISASNYGSTSYTSSGVAIVQGKSGKIRLTAQSDATNVFIELDANDDGTYESTSTMTWTQLLASI